MSDSDENAFASADEGDDKESEQNHPKKDSKEKSSAVAPKEAKKDQNVQSPSPKKGKGKNQRNKKGKASPVTPTPKDEPVDKKATSTKRDEKDLGDDGTHKTKHETVKTSTSKKDEELSSSPLAESESQDVACKTETSSKATKVDASGDQKKSLTKLSDASSLVKDTEFEESSSQAEVIDSPGIQSIRSSKTDEPCSQELQEEKTAAASNTKSSGWGWSSWGTSILSVASNSVQTFSHQVGDGLSTIMDTVESSLGVPDPESLAEADKKPKQYSTTDTPEQQTVTRQPELEESVQEVEGESHNDKEGETRKLESEEEKTSSSGGNWFSSWGVGDLAKKVQDTSKSLAAKGQNLMTEGFDAVENLAAGGIDVLETIGKKTYNTLAEHDPSFKRTRQFLSPKTSKPNLSSVLKEAREQAEKQQEQEVANQEALKAHFGTLFDDYQGIAHLEALEILSNQSEKKVHSLLNSLAQEDLADIKPQLLEIKNAFELPDTAEDTGEQDFSSLVQQNLKELELGTGSEKLNKVHQMLQDWMQDFDTNESNHTHSLKETHEKSIQALAELTAKGVEQLHKAGELVLLDKDKGKDFVERAHSLARLTSVLCHEVGNLSNKMVSCLNKAATSGDEEKSDEVTGMSTNIYLEASNSSTYIQDAFLLLLPVLQHACLEQTILAKTS